MPFVLIYVEGKTQGHLGVDTFIIVQPETHT